MISPLIADERCSVSRVVAQRSFARVVYLRDPIACTRRGAIGRGLDRLDQNPTHASSACRRIDEEILQVANLRQ